MVCFEAGREEGREFTHDQVLGASRAGLEAPQTFKRQRPTGDQLCRITAAHRDLVAVVFSGPCEGLVLQGQLPTEGLETEEDHYAGPTLLEDAMGHRQAASDRNVARGKEASDMLLAAETGVHQAVAAAQTNLAEQLPAVPRTIR